MSTEIEWRWAESDGSTHPAVESELRRLLESGQLPAYVLVWRPSWGGWLPARNVQELSKSLGKKAKAPMPPIRMPGLGQPPRPPLSKYKIAGHPEGTPILSPAETKPQRSVAPPAPSVRRSKAPPPPSARGYGSRASSPLPPPPSVPPPPKGPIQIRDVMPTLAEEVPLDRHTLKPSRAVAPPPRMPPRAEAEPLPSFADLQDSTVTLDVDEPTIPLEQAARAVGPDSSAAAFDGQTTLQSRDVDALERAESDRAKPAADATPPAKAGAGSAPTTASTPPVSDGSAPAPAGPPGAFPPAPAPSPTQPAAASSTALPGATRGFNLPVSFPAGPVRTATIVGLSVPVIALLTYLFKSEPDTGPRGAAGSATAEPAPLPATADEGEGPAARPEPAPEAVAPATAAKAAPPKACRIDKAAHRLASSAHLSVPPVCAITPDGKLGIGFAASPNAAVGITVDLESAAVKQVFSRETRNRLIGVVPGVTRGKLLFRVDTEGGELAGLRTIPADPPFAVGLRGDRFVRRSPSGISSIWENLPPGQTLSTPRVATGSDRHAIVTRIGGKNGKIATGWLEPDGRPKGPMKTVETADTDLGTPTIAVAGAEALISFAARPDAEAPWSVRLAVLQGEASPVKAQPFELPAGGPGGPAISPAAHPLPGDRFLLAWTEGSSGGRDVRAQVLDKNLAPIGDPVTLSPSGANAGQGVPFGAGNNAVVVYYVQAETGQELWGATLKCD